VGKELAEMRVRIKAMRQKLVDGLKAAGVQQDMSFITTQIGMFSYSGLTKDQMVRLRSEFGVYGTDTGRMCVAALNSKNIDYVCAGHRQGRLITTGPMQPRKVPPSGGFSALEWPIPIANWSFFAMVSGLSDLASRHR
jgi:hypothetical protein